MRLIDADKLLKEIQDSWVDGGWWVENQIEKSPTITTPEWVSVKDRLPEDDKPILIYAKNVYTGISEISISNKGKSLLEGKFVPMGMLQMNQFQSMSNMEDDILSNITHWMPLPNPPESV